MRPQICPCCGQPLSTRYGIALSPVRLRLFDLIERRPGITTAQMAVTLYPGHDLKAARRVIYTHVNHLNELLESTNVRIVRLGGAYQLAKLKTESCNSKQAENETRLTTGKRP